MKPPFVFRLLSFVFLPWVLTTLAGGAPLDVQPSINKMPAANAAAAQAEFETILQGGKPAVLAVCDHLLTPGTGDDSKTRYLLGGLAFHVARPGAEAQRQVFVQGLLETLEKTPDKQIKSFLLEQLRYCGSSECLAPLSAWLTDPDLAAPAARALVTIGAKGTDEALLKALPENPGPTTLTLLKALGERHAEIALPALAKYTASDNADLRHTALQGLADIVPQDPSRQIGEGSPVALLQNACQTAPDSREKALATALLLHHAQRLAKAGATAPAAAVCRTLVAQAGTPDYLIPPALHTLATVAGDEAIPDLAKATEISSRTISVAALQTLLAMNGAKAAAEVDRLLMQGPAHVRSALLTTLAGLEHAVHFPAIVANLDYDDPDVRHAAILVLAERQGLSHLLAHLQDCKADDIPELKKAILVCAGPNDLKDLAGSLAKASGPAPVYVSILEILGQRHAVECHDAVLAATAHGDPAVRSAALKALGSVSAPEHLAAMIERFLALTDSAEQALMLRSIVLVAKTLPDADQQAAGLLAAYPAAAPAKKAALAETLWEFGGAKALDTVIAASKDPNATIQTAAIRSLANWPDTSAAQTMLQAAKASTVLSQQVLLLRGYVRVVRAGSQPPVAKLGMYKDALLVAQRAEEKKMILGALVDIKTLESLVLLETYLDDAAIRDEAASLAVLVACGDGKQKGITDSAARPIMVKVAGIVKDEKLKQRVEKQIAGMK